MWTLSAEPCTYTFKVVAVRTDGTRIDVGGGHRPRRISVRLEPGRERSLTPE